MPRFQELNFWLSKLPLESVLTCNSDTGDYMHTDNAIPTQCCASGRMLNASVKLLGAGFRGYRSKGKADPGIGLPPSPQPAPDEAYFRPQKEQAESGNQKPGPSQVPKHPISPVITRPMVPKPTMPVIIPKYISNKNIASEIATRPPQKSNDYITMLEEIPVRERNLDQIQAKTFVWTACHQRQEAWGHDDRQPYGSGIFTKVFTHAFETYLTRLTGNDGNNAYIDYNALFIHISQNVLKETEKLNTLQFVQLWTSLQGANEEKVSSITDWIEILSRDQYNVDDYDGIPELVESVNLQAGGPTEASRAIRKKLKYGDVHRQLRALTILKALVENCGPKFQASFANDQLTDRLKLMSQDPMTDEQVKRKLMAVLGSWHRQFKDDPKMHAVSNLYIQCGGGKRSTTSGQNPTSPRPQAETLYEQHQRRAEEEAQARAKRKAEERAAKEEEKRKQKEEKLAAKERERKARSQPARRPFNYEVEKPKILNTIAEGTQAATNLVNAIKRVNREQESITTNPSVQECLATAKTVRKQTIKYIQVAIQKEEIIGTLLETNERIIASIQLYDK
ncbi:putative actin patch assembly and actin polymerization protein, partial [Ceratobasidium sp. 392]